MIGGLVLCLLMGMTHQQMQPWRSNRDLWTQAVRVNRVQARPALNLAVTYREMADAEVAIAWTFVAASRLNASPRSEELRRAIKHHLLFWDAMGTGVCGRTEARRFCSSE